jgi:hypothetical protein
VAVGSCLKPAKASTTSKELRKVGVTESTVAVAVTTAAPLIYLCDVSPLVVLLPLLFVA